MQRSFDYAQFYRWYRRLYPRDFWIDLAKVLLLLANPVNWIKAIWRSAR